ncbi:MAG TPA: hypothetical protein VFW23_09615 [Tepidisphaeraceae bacterium]|nr:hypothetical protein [Tepidisphaeraceae bacterium]
MNAIGRRMMVGLVGVSLIGLWGCDVDVEPGYAYRDYDATYVEPGPYYYEGYYDGPNYYWHDHDGHWFHEGREIHERRFNAYRARGGGERGHAEAHGGGHDGRR